MGDEEAAAPPGADEVFPAQRLQARKVTETSEGGKRGSVRDKHQLARLASRAKHIEIFADFLESQGTPILRVWFQHFDKNRIGKISHREFRTGMQTLRYAYDMDALWAEINIDSSDELFFDDVAIRPEASISASVWNDFRRWAGTRFHNPKDMIRQVKKASEKVQAEFPGQVRGAKELLFQHEAMAGFPECGWEGGQEELVWALLDVNGERGVSLKDLKWLETEARRGQAKEAARKRAMKTAENRAKSKVLCNRALVDFKARLRKQYGPPLFRAWRRVLDTDGSMTVQRAELFKVCRDLNWPGNMRWLWKALDHDGSGATTFEELDPKGALELAQFKRWAVGVWGPRFGSPMFKEADSRGKKKITYAEFAEACEKRGFPYRKGHAVAAALDCKTCKRVTEADVEIVECFKPPDWLLSEASQEAADEFKQALLRKYGHCLRGWRSALDKDNSNCCTWWEFVDAAKRIKFTGDIAGAWRAFDADLSGLISFRDLDRVAHDACMEFKMWADVEFGGIRAAYRIIDVDKSNQISFREFRSACRSYGYTGDVATLFESLDQQGTRNMLHFEEVSFLDSWESYDVVTREADDPDMLEAGLEAGDSTKSSQWEWKSITPGPGSYDLPTSFAAGPTTPQARHAGSFSFAGRLRKAWSRPKLGPTHYDPLPGGDSLRVKKPAWSFGSAEGPPPQILGMRRCRRDRRDADFADKLARVMPTESETAERLHARPRFPAKLASVSSQR